MHLSSLLVEVEAVYDITLLLAEQVLPDLLSLGIACIRWPVTGFYLRRSGPTYGRSVCTATVRRQQRAGGGPRVSTLADLAVSPKPFPTLTHM